MTEQDFRRPVPPDDDREVIEASDRRGEPAMSHIAPVMVALVEAGNRVSVRNQNFGFIPQPHGWSAYLDEPIDFDLIERRFVLPPSIHLDRANDQILRRQRPGLRLRRRRPTPPARSQPSPLRARPRPQALTTRCKTITEP